MVKLIDCRPRDCEFDPPINQLKLLIGDMYWFFPLQEKCSCQYCTLNMLKNLVCNVWWALQYFALWTTDTN